MTAKMMGLVELPERALSKSKAAFCREVIHSLVPGKAMLVEFSDFAELMKYRSMFTGVISDKKFDTYGTVISTQKADDNHLMVWLREKPENGR